MIAPAVNHLWHGLSRIQGRPFRRAGRDLAGIQEHILLRQLRSASNTRIGHERGFAGMDSVTAYRRRMPLTDYEDYALHLDAIRTGGTGVLTADRVLRFEPTSGTGDRPKLIPYTAGLRREVGRAVAPWIADLFSTWPELRGGTMYWAISPRLAVPDSGGIPVGFDRDTGYFGGMAAWLAARILPAPTALGAIQDLDTFRYASLRFLLARDDLRLISVWNPTFLEWLLAPIRDWGTDLVRDVFDGTLSRGSEPAGIRPAPQRRRARAVAAALDQVGSPWPRLWPRLAVISCWADGWAAEAIPRMRALCPQAAIQPKGLLATEAVVTIPLGRDATPVLAAASHFYEFLDAATGEIRLAHQLADDTEYEMVVTTAGGLYRYRLHDRVIREGHHRRIPVLRFLGRDEQVSDLRGEKLHASFVGRVLESLSADGGCLSPRCADGQARYELLLPSAARPSTDLAQRLDTHLRQNIHYDYCRKLGQLQAPVVRRQASDATYSGPLSTRKPDGFRR